MQMETDKVLYFVSGDSCYNFRGTDRKVVKIVYAIHALPISWAMQDETEPLPDPILLLPSEKFPCSMGFGVLGSKLYMVGGIFRTPGFGKRRLDVHSLQIHVFDTCAKPAPNSDYRDFVVSGSNLEFFKVDPIVIPLGGKLYILAPSFAPLPTKESEFSVTGKIYFDDDDELRGNFIEVFDPILNSSYPISPPIDEIHRNGYKYARQRRLCDSIDPFQIMRYTVKDTQILLYFGASSDIGIYVLETTTCSWGKILLEPGIPYTHFFRNEISLNRCGLAETSSHGNMLVHNGVELGEITVPKLRGEDGGVHVYVESRFMELDSSKTKNMVLGFSTCLLGCPCYGSRQVVFKVDLLQVKKSKRAAGSAQELGFKCRRIRGMTFTRETKAIRKVWIYFSFLV